MGILALFLLSSILVKHNLDVKGWWPFALVIGVIFQGMVAGIYAWIDKLAPASYRYTALYAGLCVLPLVILCVARIATPIDWLAVNEGVASLTLWQIITNHDWFLPSCSAIILLTHFISRYQSAHRQQALV